MALRLASIVLFLSFFPRSAIALAGYESIHAVNNSTKAGLAWPNGPYVSMSQFESTGNIQWYYTWSPNSIQSNLESVPILWGEDQVSVWQNFVNSTIHDLGVTHALAFNEPEQSAQSNLSPSDGASLWKAQLEPLKAQGILLGSPAPSSAPAGKQWLLDWLSACQGGCTPLWVTEWACQNYNTANEQCSQQNVIDFMNATQSYMDATPWVERYAWFGAMENLQGVNQANALMDASGTINSLGSQYIGATAPTISANCTPGIVDGGYGSTSSSSSRAGPLMQVQAWHLLPMFIMLQKGRIGG